MKKLTNGVEVHCPCLGIRVGTVPSKRSVSRRIESLFWGKWLFCIFASFSFAMTRYIIWMRLDMERGREEKGSFMDGSWVGWEWNGMLVSVLRCWCFGPPDVMRLETWGRTVALALQSKRNLMVSRKSSHGSSLTCVSELRIIPTFFGLRSDEHTNLAHDYDACSWLSTLMFLHGSVQPWTVLYWRVVLYARCKPDLVGISK